MRMTLRQLVESRHHKVFAFRLKEMMHPGTKMDGGEVFDVAEDDQMGDAETITAAFHSKVLEVVDDSSMDVEAKVEKIRKLLQAQEKLLTGNDPKPAKPTKPETSSDSAAMAKSVVQEAMKSPDAFRRALSLR